MLTFQAIMTRYIGPTTNRGGRVKATSQAGSVTVHWDHSLGHRENHAAAARLLALKLRWTGRYVQGGSPDDCGYVFVDAASDGFEITEGEA